MNERPGPVDLQLPFFRPLWRRVVTAGLPLARAAIERHTASVGWAMVFGAVGVYANYQFFAVRDPKEDLE